MSEQLLQVRNLSVSVEDKPILHGIDLEWEVHGMR